MWYHAIVRYGTKSRYWWNKTRDGLAKDVVIPFVTKEVVTAARQGIDSLFNFGAAEYVTILKSREKLKRPESGKTPKELRDVTYVKAHEATDDLLDELGLTPPQNTLFVIMKFGDPALDSAYEGVYKPEGRAAGFEKVVRVDEIQDSGNISQQIVEHIATSRLIIADMSGERPNCYYEAGFAHALGKPIVFCVRQQEKIHFDLTTYRFIIWDTEASLRRQIKGRLESLKEQGNG